MVRPVWIAFAFILCACGGSSTAPATPTPSAGDPPTQQGCARTSVGLNPLGDPGTGYQSEPGGLYSGGSNAMPASHLSEGLSRARAIGPLDAGGNVSSSGRYVSCRSGCPQSQAISRAHHAI